jgi:ABC-2 type transport system permease protein
VEALMSTVYILWLRQLKRYFRSKPRMIGSLGQPLIFLLAFGLGFGKIYQKAGGGDYLQFLAPGVICMAVLFTAVFSGIELIWDRQFGFLKETLVAPVPRFHIMVGRTLGGATVAMFQGLIVLLLSVLLGFRPSLAWLPAGLVFMFLAALLFTALGTTLASQLDDMQSFPLIMNFLVMPLFFFSGALFPLSGVSRGLALVAAWNPLSYGVDGLRGALGGGFYFGFGMDLAVLGLVSALFLALGSFLFSRIQA